MMAKFIEFYIALILALVFSFAQAKIDGFLNLSLFCSEELREITR